VIVDVDVAEQPVAVVGGEVGTVVGVVVDTVVGEGGLLSIAGVVVVVGPQHQGEGTASVAGEGVSRIGLSVSWNTRAHQYLHHTRRTYHPWVEVAAASPVVAQEGMPGGLESLPLAVFGFVGDCVGQNRSQEEVVVAVAVADIHTDPEKDSAAEEVVPAVGWEEGAPESSSVPYLGSRCLNLDWVVEGE